MTNEQLCPWCDEAVRDEDDARTIPHLGDAGRFIQLSLHPECALRMVIGGLNHLRGQCTCCGGLDPPDPPWLPRREAARLACAEYKVRSGE